MGIDNKDVVTDSANKNPSTPTTTLKEEGKWPDNFHGYLMSLIYSSVKQRKEEALNQPYPERSSRYSRLWINYASQDCYTAEDLHLVDQIKTEFAKLTDVVKTKKYFDLKDEKHWYDFWVCARPVENEKLLSGSFTLPSRSGKDAKSFPLNKLGDEEARRIANWLSDRFKGQNPALMNDPFALVLDELCDYFYQILSQKECKLDDLESLTKRESYLKYLTHLFPNFGPDRLRLHEIQKSLTYAGQLLTNCATNKELDQKLSDMVLAGEDLEVHLGTYLHFLLIGEEVAPNFSPEFLEGGRNNCVTSPICKIYKALGETKESTDSKLSNAIATGLAPYREINPFYHLNAIKQTDGVITLQTELNESPLKVLKFASFVKEQDKKTYLQAVASLQSLINVRKVLIRFQDVQNKVGTYLFAYNYQKEAEKLAANYMELIQKSKELTTKLIKIADEGSYEVMRNAAKHPDKSNQMFERNMNLLETKIAQGTTVTAQLDHYCARAVKTIHSYEEGMKKLVTDIHSGFAKEELARANQELFEHMNYLNKLLPAFIGKETLMIDTNLGNNPQLIKGYTQESQQMLTAGEASATECDLSQEGEVSEISLMKDEGPPVDFDHARWDDHIDHDPITLKPIYTFRVYKGEEEMGSISFYGHRMLHFSDSNQQNNIVKMTGIFCEVAIAKNMPIADICKKLPNTLFDDMYVSVLDAGKFGLMRGGANVVGMGLKTLGVRGVAPQCVSHCLFYTCVFAVKYHEYLAYERKYAETANQMNAWMYAALETGKLGLFHLATNMVGFAIQQGGEALEKYNWQTLGKRVKQFGSIGQKYGLFAYQVYEKGLPLALASFGTGALVQTGTEMGAQKLGELALRSIGKRS